MPDAKLTDGVIKYSGSNGPDWISNIGIDLTSGVLKIVDSSGNDLTSSNPGYFSVGASTSISQRIVVSQSFNDDAHASSSLTNLGFGITETANWANSMPFFLYLVDRDGVVDGTDGGSAFFITRDPRMFVTPASADDIGDTGAIPVNDSQDVILIMDDVTVADYINRPCQIVGAFVMQWSTTTDDWTVQVITDNHGVGNNQIRQTIGARYTMPLGQNGAAAGTHLEANGGTAPIFSTDSYDYYIDENGFVECFIRLDADGGTDGVGAVTTLVTIPYAATTNLSNTTSGAIAANSAVTGFQTVNANVINATTHFQLVEAGGSVMQNGDFTNGTRQIDGRIRYKAFSN